MKAILLASLLLAAAPPAALAQTPARAAAPRVAGRTLRLGAASVEVPTPAGFDEAASQFETVRTYFSATEDPNNEMAAVHLPAAAVAQLGRGEAPDMSFYTKVSVNKGLKEVDFDASKFASVISTFERQGVKLLDPANPELRAKLRRVEEVASSVTGGAAKMSLSAPELLGEFNRTPNVYGVMLSARVTIRSGEATKEVPMLCAASFVMVRSRLIYVYAYRRFNSDADLTVLKDFARKWADQIVAANRT